MVEAGGVEPPLKPCKIAGSDESLTHQLTHGKILCPELCEIMDSWESLPDHIRLSMLALVRSVKGGAQ